jgi:hypothetical protein
VLFSGLSVVKFNSVHVSTCFGAVHVQDWLRMFLERGPPELIRSVGLTHTDIDLRKPPSMYCPLRRDLSCGPLALNLQVHLQDGLYTLCRGYNVNGHWIDRLSIPLCCLLPYTFYNYARCSSDGICGTILIFLSLLSSCRKTGYYPVIEKY